MYPITNAKCNKHMAMPINGYLCIYHVFFKSKRKIHTTKKAAFKRGKSELIITELQPLLKTEINEYRK